jgi:hypothetical protein
MATMENPFRDYNPPTGSDVFSPWGKKDIAEFKMTLITNGITQALLEGDTLERFTGGIELTLRYNRIDLLQYISFDSLEDEDATMRSLARDGFSAALDAADREFEGELGVVLYLCGESPGRANLIMRCFTSNSDISD